MGTKRVRIIGAALAVVLAAGVLAGCQTVRPGARCRTSDFAQSGDFVMVCRGGRWTRLMTKGQAASAIVALINSKTTTTTAAPRSFPVGTTTVPQPPPTIPPPPPAGPKATAVAVTGDHACAVVANGTVRCWGDNHVGQLGNGEGPFPMIISNGPIVTRDVPVTVVGITDAVDVGVGTGFSCALRATGTVSCWGDNSVGQLGTDTRPPVAPGEVPGLDTAVDSVVPLPIDGLSGVTDLEVGLTSACAIRGAGELWCWGGQGGGTVPGGDPAFTPRHVAVIGPVSSVAIASDHTCAVRTDALLACWGNNTFGQSGGPASGPIAPQSMGVPGVAGVTSVQVGDLSTCAVASGAVRCLGNATAPTFASQPPELAARMAWAGCGVGLAGALYCWNVSDPNRVPWMLGSTPVDMGLRGVADISGTRWLGCAVSGGAVWCYGHNGLGQLGNGTEATSGASFVPVRVSGIG